MKDMDVRMRVEMELAVNKFTLLHCDESGHIRRVEFEVDLSKPETTLVDISQRSLIPAFACLRQLGAGLA